jgi:flagella basal body P-ring formation protein FlgA
MLCILAMAFAASTPEQAIRDAVAARVGVPVTDVEVQPLGLPEGTGWAAELPAVGVVWGVVPVTVRGVLPTGDARYAVRPRIEVFKQLPVATLAVSSGEVVPVTIARVAMDSLRGATPVDATRAWEARVDLPAQTPLTTRSVRLRPDAKAGRTVSIIAGSGPLRVMAPGQLSEDAFVGATVHVVNLATRVVLVGTFTEDGHVDVGGTF